MNEFAQKAITSKLKKMGIKKLYWSKAHKGYPNMTKLYIMYLNDNNIYYETLMYYESFKKISPVDVLGQCQRTIEYAKEEIREYKRILNKGFDYNSYDIATISVFISLQIEVMSKILKEEYKFEHYKSKYNHKKLKEMIENDRAKEELLMEIKNDFILSEARIVISEDMFADI